MSEFLDTKQIAVLNVTKLQTLDLIKDCGDEAPVTIERFRL